MSTPDTHRPTAGTVEDRHAPVTDTLQVDGPRLRGRIPYGVESRDMGGWTEIIEPGALSGARLDDLVATVDHAGVPIGRHPRTLELEDRADGLHWSVELPESRSDVREAVERGDLRSGSWRMIVGREEWRGEVRHVHEIAELRDVAVVTIGAYTAAATEYRAAPEQTPEAARAAQDTPEAEEAPMQTTDRQEGGAGLAVEDRSAEEPTVEARVLDAIRSVRKGESRSLTTTNAEPIAPVEVATFLWDRLRPASIALASGVRVIPTDRQSITWPRLTADVDPTWVPETVQIPAGDPAFGTLTASPKKLAHRVELSNEVIDDSEPSIVDVLNVHLATMLALKLDRGIFEGNPAADAESIRGLKFVTGTQVIDMGANGGALVDYDPVLEAVGLLQASNVPGPYAVAMHPRTATALALLRTATGSNEQLVRPADLPALFTSSQLSIAEAKGTATTTSSAYVYAPSEVVLVRRQDAEVELDRSRLFDRDMSEMRAKLRADLIVPNPSAVVRVQGILAA
jgi:HK97 family phage major capsid protein